MSNKEEKKENKENENPTETVDLAQVVQESKEILKEGEGQAKPIKSKRGRPKKSNPVPDPESKPVENPPTSLKPMLATVVGLPATYAASTTDYPGFNLNSSEKEMLASQADVLAQTYIPNASQDPNAPLYLFLASYGFTMFGKYLEYLKWKKAREDEEIKIGQVPAGGPIVQPAQPYPQSI